MTEPFVYLYALDTTQFNNREVYDYWYQQVTPNRREKIDSILNDESKALSLGVECLLLNACSELGVDYTQDQITQNEYGKPHFETFDIQFNLSHSHERAMCIVSSNEVGCDVEKIRDVKLEVAKRFFVSDEYQKLAICKTDTERAELFYKLWTLKESFMKCTGLGFHLPLNEFSIDIQDSNISVKQSVDEAEYYLYTQQIDDYQYSWCIRDRAFPNSNIHFKNLMMC